MSPLQRALSTATPAQLSEGLAMWTERAARHNAIGLWPAASTDFSIARCYQDELNRRKEQAA